MPLIMNKGHFIKGFIGLALFLLVLVPMLTPTALTGGITGMEFADNLFNSLSKGSSYYIPAVQENIGKYNGTELSATIKTKDADQAALVTKMFTGAGAEVTPGDEGTLAVKGDLGSIFSASVIDADNLFNENEQAITSLYGTENARAVLYYWYDSYNQIYNNLMEAGQTENALFIKGSLLTRAIEPAYNFAGIPAAKVSEKAGITIFLLTFYVAYTLWYGFSIMYIFEGLGITASKTKKAEA